MRKGLGAYTSKKKQHKFVMLECAIAKKKFDVSSKKSVPFLVVLYQSFHINTISLGLQLISPNLGRYVDYIVRPV